MMYSTVHSTIHPPTLQKMAMPHCHQLVENGASSSAMPPVWRTNVPPNPTLADLGVTDTWVPSQIIQTIIDFSTESFALVLAGDQLD